nr:hypothetical protein RVX_0461 [Nitratidesulfovibrio sp. HK-II]
MAARRVLPPAQLCNIAAGDGKGGDAAILRQGAAKEGCGAFVVRQGLGGGALACCVPAPYR